MIAIAFVIFTCVLCFYLAATAGSILVPLLALSVINNIWFLMGPYLLRIDSAAQQTAPVVPTQNSEVVPTDDTPLLFDDEIAQYRNDFNDAAAYLTKSRNLDRASQLAAAVKNVNSYKPYFESELQQNEARDWWGAND